MLRVKYAGVVVVVFLKLRVMTRSVKPSWFTSAMRSLPGTLSGSERGKEAAIPL